MGDWLLNLPVLAMGAVILGAIYLLTAALYLAIMGLAVGERTRAFTGISGGILSPLAIIFALLVGFLAAQVWNDADRAAAAVNHEASALRAVVFLAAAFPGDSESRIRDLVHDHIQEVVSDEWPAMARGDATLTLAPPRLAEALGVAMALPAGTPGQVAAQRELVTSLDAALDARRQRIILSHTYVNWVKWTVLLLQAGLTLITIGMIHCENPLANRIIMGIFATSVGIAVVLIASHSRPFTGEISVKPTYLLQVVPEAGMTGSSRSAP